MESYKVASRHHRKRSSSSARVPVAPAMPMMFPMSQRLGLNHHQVPFRRYGAIPRRPSAKPSQQHSKVQRHDESSKFPAGARMPRPMKPQHSPSPLFLGKPALASSSHSYSYPALAFPNRMNHGRVPERVLSPQKQPQHKNEAPSSVRQMMYCDSIIHRPPVSFPHRSILSHDIHHESYDTILTKNAVAVAPDPHQNILPRPSPSPSPHSSSVSGYRKRNSLPPPQAPMGVAPSPSSSYKDHPANASDNFKTSTPARKNNTHRMIGSCDEKKSATSSSERKEMLSLASDLVHMKMKSDINCFTSSPANNISRITTTAIEPKLSRISDLIEVSATLDDSSYSRPHRLHPRAVPLKKRKVSVDYTSTYESSSKEHQESNTNNVGMTGNFRLSPNSVAIETKIVHTPPTVSSKPTLDLGQQTRVDHHELSPPLSIPHLTIANERRPTSLALPSDSKNVNSLHAFVRSSLLELFVLDTNSEDMSGCHFPGRVGLRCVHCKHLPKDQKDIGAVFFPRNMKSLYRSVCTWQRVHFKACSCVSKKDKAMYEKLKAGDKTRGRTRYWETSAMELGLVDVLGVHGRGGIMFQ